MSRTLVGSGGAASEEPLDAEPRHLVCNSSHSRAHRSSVCIVAPEPGLLIKRPEMFFVAGVSGVSLLTTRG